MITQSVTRVSTPRVTVEGGLSSIQLLLTIAFPFITLIGLLLWPISALRVLVSCGIAMFAIVSAFKCYAALRSDKGVVIIPEPLLRYSQCPRYTVFVPAYHEGAVLPQLIDSLKKLRYPKTKLDVFLILEEDDQETRQIAEDLDFPYWINVVVVPKTHHGPKGKPRAMMYAVEMGLVQGRYITIYDAEDRMDDEQLHKAATAFHHFPEISCFQAELRWGNATQNVWTRMIAASYALNWAWMFPGNAAVGGIPLFGGTSQHLRVRDVASAGWWDPTNVTEDLGLAVAMRIAGFKAMMLDSVTWEEATATPRAQMKQMSRWIKGHTATFIAFTRNPVWLFRSLGWNGSLSFLSVVGASHPAALAAPVFWSMTALYATTRATIIQEITAPIAFYVGLACLAMNALFVWKAMLAVIKTRQFSLVPWMILLPLYWLTVLTAAGAKAGWEVVSGRLYYWDKTEHVLVVRPEKEVSIDINN